MAIESRGGRSYYYRKVREGGRVRSIYIGNGEPADLMQQMDQIERQVRQDEREAWKSERGAMEAEDREVDDWYGAIEAAADLALEAAGYHKHRGQWRRRRDVRDPGPGR
jgi:hypothetical protein